MKLFWGSYCKKVISYNIYCVVGIWVNVNVVLDFFVWGIIPKVWLWSLVFCFMKFQSTPNEQKVWLMPKVVFSFCFMCMFSYVCEFISFNSVGCQYNSAQHYFKLRIWQQPCIYKKKINLLVNQFLSMVGKLHTNNQEALATMIWCMAWCWRPNIYTP
jgi:hypothetical protein